MTDDGFLLKTKQGQERHFSFTEVQKIKKSGMSTGTKVLIGVGVGVGAYVAIAW